MTNLNIDLEQLINNDEWLKQAEEHYCHKLRQQIFNLKRSVLNHLRQKHSLKLDQHEIRALSQHYAATHHEPPSLFGSLPLAIGSSKQDAMHHTHWLQAALLLHELDEVPHKLQTAAVKNFCVENLDEPSRLEEQFKVYYNLALHILKREPQNKAVIKRITNEQLMQALAEQTRLLKQLLEQIQSLHKRLGGSGDDSGKSL